MSLSVIDSPNEIVSQSPYTHLINADCFDVFPHIPDGSVDMILADLPYGTTACKWDSILPFNKLWDAYKRIIKPNGAIVLTASQPFTSALVMSNPKWFRYDWVWKKTKVTNVLNAKKQPLRSKEDIIVFSEKNLTYNPQGIFSCSIETGTGVSKSGKQSEYTGKITQTKSGKYLRTITGYPRNILDIKSEGKTIHPTQKPVALFEYLIKTYTNEGDLVLDNTAGVFTTCVAAHNTNRRSIGIEKEADYYQKGLGRFDKIISNPSTHHVP